jgi:hypothetical protein
MKKLSTLALIVILTGCAQQRTTPYYSTQGMPNGVPGKPIVSVLTNPDYDQQQLNKKTDTTIKPVSNKIVPLEEGFTQADLSTLFESMNVRGVELGLPEGVICEFIPQLRIQKTLGRLRCMKQTPETINSITLQNGTRYECSVNTSTGAKITEDDAKLYEGLNIAPIDEASGRSGATIDSKRVGEFYCTKVREVYPNAVPNYSCGLESQKN